MKRYLITGSSGFIGSKLLTKLSLINNEIRLLSRNHNPNFETIICDFQKEKIPNLALKSIDTIIHVAGIAHDLKLKKADEKIYTRVNVDASVELANLAIQNGVKSFVYVSSVKASDNFLSEKCGDEKNQFDPSDIYGKTKRQAEIKLLALAKNSSLHLSIIRPALVYGPGVKGNLHLMMSAIKKGRFPPIPDVSNKRSMIHVDDLINAILMLSEDKRANGEIFIATDGNQYSTREIYTILCHISGKKVPNWTLPTFLFSLLSLISKDYNLKVRKLLGDDCYSSKKLESLGFKPKKILEEINETSF
jgi:UDP-glucose 4-epimerase